MDHSSSKLEKYINWRLARFGFSIPYFLPYGAWDHECIETEISVFLPCDPAFNLIAVRDWLHDPNNNVESYRMIGRYEVSSARTKTLGIKFQFSNAIDAVYFRLSWAATTSSR